MANIKKIVLPTGEERIIVDSTAEHFIGITTTVLTDGANTSPIKINNQDVVPITNDVVVLDSNHAPFIFNGSTWTSMQSTAIAPGDGTITIKRNNTTVKYFSLNQVDDEDIDIEVPVLGISVNGTAITPDSSTKVANITSVPASIISAGALANGMTATTQTSTDDSTKLATTAFVHDVVDGLPEPMQFKGSATITASSSDTTKCSITVSKPASSSIETGFTYKITSIAATPKYTGSLKVGDTIIALLSPPKVDSTWVVDTDWSVIPSGDEPSGTVTSIGAGTGLLTSETGNLPIETQGTISLNLKTAAAFSGAVGSPDTSAPIYPVNVDKNGQLAVAVPSITFDPTSDAYNASTNPAATVDTVNDAIDELNISSTTASVHGLSDTSVSSVLSNLTAATPAAADATGEVFYAVMGENADSETLFLKKIVKSTTSTTTTTNLLKKNTN